MQIPATPLKALAGFFAQPPSGSPRHIGPAPQVKANAQPTTNRVRPAATATANPLSQSGTARTLDEAVDTLRAQGRLPPRGSLFDIRA